MARSRREARRGRRGRTTERPGSRHDWTRYAAPAAFLLAATIAILLIRSGLRGTDDAQTTGRATTAIVTTTTGAAKKKPNPPKAAGAAAYYTVVAGDTFGVIATKNSTTVARIESLNPGVKSTSLFVGQRIRVK